MKTIEIKSSKRSELIDITAKVAEHVSGSGNGMCIVYTPHTTAAVTINENADPDVKSDIVKGLDALSINRISYEHAEGNSPAHIKSSLLGCSELIPIENGKLCLGTWQGIYFCEFDGPRQRRVYVQIIAG